MMLRILLLLGLIQWAFIVSFFGTANGVLESCAGNGIVPRKRWQNIISIRWFGAIGDGKTLNTEVFQAAISTIRQHNSIGGTLLYIPAGIWLTRSFNLTSHMTLYLAKNAVIKASRVATGVWPLINPLPSYDRGRERPGERYISLIHGDNLEDVAITGENVTINGQGEVWWNMQ